MSPGAGGNGRSAGTVSAIRSQAAHIPAPPFIGARTLDDGRSTANFGPASIYAASTGSRGVRRTQRATRSSGSCAKSSNRGCGATKAEAEGGAILRPKAVYGYFPAAAEGDDVVLFDPAGAAREIARFTFARQVGGEHLCLADYVRELGKGAANDVVALQIVTVGDEAARRIEELHVAGDYSESYFLHGFSVQAAEALAEYVHRRIRAELELEPDRGKRYSWGYGACPDLAQHEIVFRLLDATQRIGVVLTQGFQIVPEQSTAAIVHPPPEGELLQCRSNARALDAQRIARIGTACRWLV